MISKSTEGGLTANECDRDMSHRRIGLGAMPMPFTGLDMHTSPTLIPCCSCSVATIPEPEVTIKIWSQLCVCHPVVQPWLKFTTLQL